LFSYKLCQKYLTSKNVQFFLPTIIVNFVEMSEWEQMGKTSKIDNYKFEVASNGV